MPVTKIVEYQSENSVAAYLEILVPINQKIKSGKNLLPLLDEVCGTGRTLVITYYPPSCKEDTSFESTPPNESDCSGFLDCRKPLELHRIALDSKDAPWIKSAIRERSNELYSQIRSILFSEFSKYHSNLNDDQAEEYSIAKEVAENSPKLRR